MKEEIITEEIITGPAHEVTLTDVLVRLWLHKYTLVLWIIVGIVLGAVIIAGTPRQYTATLTMMPETGDSKKSTSAALAALGMASEIKTDDAYNPSIYPEIVSSIPFITALFDVEVQKESSDTTYTLRTYLEHNTRQAWWKTIFGGRKQIDEYRKNENEVIDPFHLTRSENSMYKLLAKCITLDVDRKTAQLTVSVTMQDPLVAAQVTDTVAARLQEYITDYRTAKARHDLDYAIELNEEAKTQYYQAQQTYAEYMDRNQGLALYSAQTTRDRLENEMQLAFNLYNQTSQQLQQCEAKVQEVTPVFAVVQPSSVPLYPSSPRKGMIMGFCIFLFTATGILVLCMPLFFSKSFRKRLVEEKNREQTDKAHGGKGFMSVIFHKTGKKTDSPETEVDGIEEVPEDTSSEYAPRDSYVLPDEDDKPSD